LLQNPYDTTDLTLGMLLHYFGKLKNSNFLQMFRMGENANKYLAKLKAIKVQSVTNCILIAF